MRFSDVTDYLADGEEAITGAFDWSKREGWTEERYRGSAGLSRQVGDECFSGGAGQAWKHWHAPGRCADEFEDPAKVLAGLRSLGQLEEVGQEEILGVTTTHYRFVPDDEYYDNPEQWQEIWLGKGDVVYRLRRPRGEAAARVRDYFDFGVEVDVKPPCTPAGADGDLPPCEEETG